jgi:signal transduction histidine kinase
MSQPHEGWLIVLLLCAVLVPAVCLLWFMAAAMKNERFAVRQKLTEIYRGQLVTAQARLGQAWEEISLRLEKSAINAAAPAAFARCVRAGQVDAVILFDEQGRITYPRAPFVPITPNHPSADLEPGWSDAGQLEFLRRNYGAAAAKYAALATASTNVDLAARARQAQIRCLVQDGQTNAAVELIADVLGNDSFGRASDAQGRLVAANAELMALEMLSDRQSEKFGIIARRLKQRLLDYDNAALASPQRRFLLKELQRLYPEGWEQDTLAAEELAAEVSESRPIPGRIRGLQRTALPDVWQFVTHDRRVLALIRFDTLLSASGSALSARDPVDAEVTLVPPDRDRPDAFLTIPAGEWMPGWRLALLLNEHEFFDHAGGGGRTGIYLWTGILAMAAGGVLTVLTLRLARRQMALARLKNDLAATVSHELRTPLSSMRVLVDTLLDSGRLEEEKTREYLQLIAQENDRLARLIQNFLSFSRMERKKYAFHFSPSVPGQIVRAATDSVRRRWENDGGCLEVTLDEPLPAITADPDALTAALINLLENAYKYADAGSRRIHLRATARDHCVIFSVQDNGIGIAPRERRRIFQPFYQVDHRLSREGSGCGLGLSIVQYITTAHGGDVSVESQPGGGSTFTISIPAAPNGAESRQEVIA